MNASKSTDHGIALLRIALGTMSLSHGLLKFFVFTLAGTAGFFESLGLPGALAYVVAPAEALAGIALLAGFRTRIVSLALIPVLAGAVWAHAGNGWVFSAPNGGWEFPAYLVVLAVVQAVLGRGAWAVDNLRGSPRPALATAAS